MPHPPMKPPKPELTAQEAAYAGNAARFRTFEFETGGHRLTYNLFAPEDVSRPLPLVVFMHDMGSISDERSARAMCWLRSMRRSPPLTTAPSAGRRRPPST